jgi:hypothetical protein
MLPCEMWSQKKYTTTIQKYLLSEHHPLLLPNRFEENFALKQNPTLHDTFPVPLILGLLEARGIGRNESVVLGATYVFRHFVRARCF